MIQLTRRERRLGIGMLAVGLAWSLYGFILEPMQDRIETLRRVIPEKQSELREVRALSDRYLALRRNVDNLHARMTAQDSDFQLLPFLEALIEQQQLTPVATMERDTISSQPGYTETLVEIDLADVTLQQLINFLQAVETSGALAHVSSLHIRRSPANDMRLKSTIQIRSPRLDPDAMVADAAQS
jgi:type II secretory pathway component PulM